MKIDGGIGGALDKVAGHAAALEKLGYDGVLVAETSHDPFLPCLAAAQGTEDLDISTAIAVPARKHRLANVLPPPEGLAISVPEPQGRPPRTIRT